MTAATAASSRTERAESAAQILILLFVAGMAGAASFTHVHDWTMRNAPPGTGSWFGWANAIITELVPAAAGIEVRRRKRHHRPVTYPMTVLITDAAVSLAAQLSDATHTLGGGLAFALPALAFLALTKLALSRAASTPGDTPCAEPAPAPDAPGRNITVPVLATRPTASSARAAAPAPTIVSAASPLTPEPGHHAVQPVSSGQLLISARMTAFAHQQATGHPITESELAERLDIPPALAGSLLDHLGGTIPPPVTAANGTPVTPGGQP